MVDMVETRSGDKVRFKLPVFIPQLDINLLSYVVICMKRCKRCDFMAMFHNNSRGINV